MVSLGIVLDSDDDDDLDALSSAPESEALDLPDPLKGYTVSDNLESRTSLFLLTKCAPDPQWTDPSTRMSTTPPTTHPVDTQGSIPNGNSRDKLDSAETHSRDGRYVLAGQEDLPVHTADLANLKPTSTGGESRKSKNGSVSASGAPSRSGFLIDLTKANQRISEIDKCNYELINNSTSPTVADEADSEDELSHEHRVKAPSRTRKVKPKSHIPTSPEVGDATSPSTRARAKRKLEDSPGLIQVALQNKSKENRRDDSTGLLSGDEDQPDVQIATPEKPKRGKKGKSPRTKKKGTKRKAPPKQENLVPDEDDDLDANVPQPAIQSPQPKSRKKQKKIDNIDTAGLRETDSTAVEADINRDTETLDILPPAPASTTNRDSKIVKNERLMGSNADAKTEIQTLATAAIEAQIPGPEDSKLKKEGASTAPTNPSKTNINGVVHRVGLSKKARIPSLLRIVKK
ncbi:MAG: hypothetical protein M1825_000374 [Sarcosagium campestre]|nr:MAG: hypothetical protein M1825_000374 [Sarcosagium campestre]